MAKKSTKVTIEVSEDEVQAFKEMLDCADTEIQQLFACKDEETINDANRLLPIWRRANRLKNRINRARLSARK